MTTNHTNTVRVAHVLRRLDPELSASDAVHIARHTHWPVRVLCRESSDVRLSLAGRLDRLPDHHSWSSLGEIMWRALKIRARLGI